MSIQLHRGSRVCIVGGGPAGCFSAIHLLKLARARDLDLEVLIYEPHDGCTPGTRGCKGCAGILSAGAVGNLAALGLHVPEAVIQSERRAYVVHVQGEVATIEQPDPARRIFSIYRGAGPRWHVGAPLAGFDHYLRQEAQALGAQLIPERVRRVTRGERPVVHTDHSELPADLVVLATGVNSRSPLHADFGYDPPESEAMAQDEVLRPADWPDHTVAAFFGGLPELVFGALVPKGPYLNVSLLWRGVATDAIERFYQANAAPLKRFFVDSPASLCGCHPRINVRPSQSYFGDRWVAVGDTAVSRLYKDGINSALITSGAAMHAVMAHGIARADFARAYAPTCRRLAADNAYGKMIFAFSSHIMQGTLQARAFMSCVRAEADRPPEQRIHSRLLWGILTGDEPYRDLFWLIVNPRGVLRLGQALVKTALGARRS